MPNGTDDCARRDNTAWPAVLRAGSSGNGSAVNLSTELLKSMTRTHMVHIPYRGSAPALNDLMGGHIQLFMDAAVGLIAPGKAGKVRLIGVASEKRLAVLPDVPTFIEQGIAGFTGSTWAGILAPAGTPPDILRRVADEVTALVKLDDVRERFDAMGTVPVGGTPAEFERVLCAVYIAGASMWPQYDPEDEKGKIEKLLAAKRRASDQGKAEELIARAKALDEQAKALAERIKALGGDQATASQGSGGAGAACNDRRGGWRYSQDRRRSMAIAGVLQLPQAEMCKAERSAGPNWTTSAVT